MKESPNKGNPYADVIFIIEELYNLFNEAEGSGELEPAIELRSHCGSTFHARVMEAAKYYGIARPAA